MMACYNEGTPEGQQLYWDLMGCVSQVCGFPPDAFCTFQAYFGACSTEYQACQKN